MKLSIHITGVLAFTVLLAGCDDVVNGGIDNGDDTDDVSQTFSLSVDVTPEEAGTTDPESGEFGEGETVTLEADSEIGWEFDRWSGDLESEDNPVEFTMDEDKQVTAEFLSMDYEVSVQVEPGQGGSVNPGTGEYPSGATVEQSAEASDGWGFVEWTGDVESTDNPLSFVIEEHTGLTAHFEDQRSEYVVEFTLADNRGELDELRFGQQQDAWNEDAPPTPPENGLHGYFLTNEEELFVDVRSWLETEVDWDLHYQLGRGDELSLGWEIGQERMDGTLTLLYESEQGNTVEVNMLDESDHVVAGFSEGQLLITYRFE